MLENACPKPARGSEILRREVIAAEAEALERRVKAEVKRRDGRCRWPEAHKCRCGLEAAHIQDASLGGLMAPENLVLVCGFLHRRGPESVHGKQLRIEPLTSAGANGPLAFYRRNADGSYYVVAQESSPGIIERD